MRATEAGFKRRRGRRQVRPNAGTPKPPVFEPTNPSVSAPAFCCHLESSETVIYSKMSQQKYVKRRVESPAPRLTRVSYHFDHFCLTTATLATLFTLYNPFSAFLLSSDLEHQPLRSFISVLNHFIPANFYMIDL
jgi:hypothetical protein